MNKYIKNIRVGLLALTTISLLTACGGGGGTPATTSSSGIQAVTCDGVCFKVGTQP